MIKDMSAGLNDDLIERIEILLKSSFGDAGRLEHIQDSVKKGKQLYPSDQKYLESLLSVKTVQKETKSKPDDTTEEKMKPDYSHTDTQPKFCGKCGASLSVTNKFCTKCGFPTQNASNPPKLGSVESDSTHGAPSSRNISTISHSFNKFMIGLSVLLFIGAVYTSSTINGAMAIILFIISYVSLKNQSKTVGEITLVASFLLLILSVFNLVRH